MLREPDYRRLFLGRTTSLVGDGIAPVALAFAVLDLTGSATDLGIVLAVHSLAITALVLEPLTLALIWPRASGSRPPSGSAPLAMTLCQLCVLLVPSIRRLEARPDATGLRAMPPPRPLEAED